MTEEQKDIEYLRTMLESALFAPVPFYGEDRNLCAFNSHKQLVEWYCQPPGVVDQPYRDRAFYPRELAHLSRTVRPRTIVEFGTNLGIGTCLLAWLNPQAELTTVDIREHTQLYGVPVTVKIGHLARHQKLRCDYVTRWNSCNYKADSRGGVNLCFIDADHNYEAVLADSHRAWANRSRGRPWCIIWHDHNDRHPGVVQAVAEFCALVGVKLQSRPDSDTVWIQGDE